MLKSMYTLGGFDDGSDDGDQPAHWSHPHNAWYEALFIVGTANEIGPKSSSYTDFVAGHPVIGVGRGQHDGQPAIVLNLGSAGRIALAEDAEVEWVRDFCGDDGHGHDRMDAFLKAFDRSKNPPKVSKIGVDISFDKDEKRDDLIAQWAADYGVSFHLLKEHGPGGGNPYYEVTGLTDKVEAWLRGPYEADNDDVRTYLYADA